MGKQWTKLYKVELREVDVGTDLYAGDSENRFCDFLQKPYKKGKRIYLEKLIKPSSPVFWLGREFRRNDFFGLDKAGYLVIVEVKFGDNKPNPEQIKKYIKKYYGRRGFRRDKFQKKCIDYVNGNWKYKMAFANDIRRYGSFEKAYFKKCNKRFDYKGTKIYIIAPTMDSEIITGISDLRGEFGEKAKGRVKFKYVLIEKRQACPALLYFCRINMSRGI